MKATGKVLATALAAAGLMTAGAAWAAEGRGGHGGGHGANGGGNHSGHWQRGNHGGNWHRGAGVHGGHWRGGGHWGGHWGGYRHWGWGPSVSFAFGVPLAFGPWWDPWYYPRETVVYREVLREPEIVETFRDGPAPGEAEAPPPALVPPTGGSPLSMSYCASARAYFPQVRSCPEGWAATPPTR